ncbi:multifunctional methyltransferase subunit TRM112 [Vairimorpha necatrix]|uniref:Multifunctional methyltransferase subunit TRM112 n=1 Tax=Vairimorpha necatrix TaxID=6039 RepID=A0AAX4JDE9_9MICR
MKIFVQSIFKCKKCPFSTKTSLKINEWEEVESNYKLENLRNLLLSNEGREFLEKLKLQFDILTQEDLENPLESENIRKVLLETNVVDGYLECDNCKIIYPIKDSILDTVDVIEPIK